MKLNKILATSAFVLSSLLAVACGGVKHVEGTAGLKYELSEDGTHYVFSKGYDAVSGDIVIGNWHEENGKALPVTEIGMWPFTTFSYDGEYTKVKSITVSEGITTLQEGALGACDVEKIVLPNGIETIGVACFLIDFNLRELTIGKGLKKIEVDAFEKVTDLTINFRGTEAEWKAVEVAEGGNANFDTYKVNFNYKG